MKRDEVIEWLKAMFPVLYNDGQKYLGEEVEILATYRIKELTSQSIAKEYAEFILPPGKRGRITLVLASPYEARVIALIHALLINME